MSNIDASAERLRFSTGLTGYHYLVLAVACMGWGFDTMDQWLFVFVKQHAVRDLLGAGVSDADVSRYVGYAQSCMLIGWATGGLIFGMVGDRLGRTRTMAITILMYAVFTGLSGMARTWEQFAILRVLMGMGVGGEFAAGAALVAETFPDHSRAAALGIVQATSALGNVAAGLINLTITSFIAPELAWRWIFFIGALPALLIIVILAYIREPEKWKAARAEALKHKAEGKANAGSILALFTDANVRRHTLIGASIATIGVIGFWGISTWTPELLRGILKAQTSDPRLVERYVSFAGMSQNLGSFFGALCFASLANRYGRRPAFAIALLGCAVVIPLTFYFTTTFMLALSFFFAMGFMLLLLLAGFAVYFPELFPTRLRATGAGFCYNVARYTAAIFPTFFGALGAMFGIQLAALMLSSIFILGLLLLPFAPETRGKPLPE